MAATVTVRLPPALMSLFPGAPERVEVEAATVAGAVEALNARWPGMRDRLCDSTPRIRRNINMFVGGRRARLETGLAAGAEIVVMTGVTG
jgi:molybdopterin converting factor small subunit